MKTKVSLAQKIASAIGVDSGPANWWPVEAVAEEPELAKYNRTVQVKRGQKFEGVISVGLISARDLPAVIRARIQPHKRHNKKQKR